MIFAAASTHVPHLVWTSPFAALLFCIALLPMFGPTSHWWHKNRNKLVVSLLFAAITLVYYGARAGGIHIGGHELAPGLPTVMAILQHSVLGEYVPFISLLLSLYVIAGGVRIKGDIPAHPITNTGILAVGGLIASLIGTTGASMLLIRPLLNTNSERTRVTHTVVFFIFIVSNIGGTLLPIGDPPLFLGYLRGVPFLWTLVLWKEWAFCLGALLIIYLIWDSIAYRCEPRRAIRLDEKQVEKIKVAGTINFLWLAAVVFVTGTMDPSKPFLHSGWTPPVFLRELIQLLLTGASLASTPDGLRKSIGFSYEAIIEVACLFLGIFIAMQVPIEILHAKGASLGLHHPTGFFWATGLLSSLLDNAPTYVVFFETANSMTHAPGAGISQLIGGDYIRQDLLVAISLGAVFMGANTYIGNGPNFMVKSIAERAGVKMPSFFHYMIYSGLVLIPLFVAITFIFLR
jgi:Na+/H+ antiporter NhaD/arsenite permease-like protein